MKRRVVAIAAGSITLVALYGCGRSSDPYRGELRGVSPRPAWSHVMPYGTVYIPTGTLHVGPSDEDVNFALVQRTKQITITGFYMDDTEISNNEYRQFVYWVQDSIIRKALGGEYILNEGDVGERINWKLRIRWDRPEVQEVIEQELLYPAEDRFWGRAEVDKSKLNYEYSWIDYVEAAKRSNAGKPRSSFIRRKVVNVYPDTLVWVRDFTYSYNEPMTRQYFWHPAYDDYPVVGVTWHQAMAFCIWRTRLWNDYREERGEIYVDDFRLPTEWEWEYAARGGKKASPYPWGGPYIRNRKGCILANFKPGRGNYPEDGGAYTVKVNAYWPNDYGLYNMSGNVAEWTSTTYNEQFTTFAHDFNPQYHYDAKDDDAEALKRKVIRGGSWKDVAYFIQTGTRSYEYQDTAKSYVGFRCVMSFMGRHVTDKP